MHEEIETEYIPVFHLEIFDGGGEFTQKWVLPKQGVWS